MPKKEKYVEVKIKPGLKRLNSQFEDVIAVAPEYAKTGMTIDIDGVTTKVVEVLTSERSDRM